MWLRTLCETKSVHRRFVHSIYWTHRYYTPTWATQCANVVWLDLGGTFLLRLRVRKLSTQMNVTLVVGQ